MDEDKEKRRQERIERLRQARLEHEASPELQAEAQRIFESLPVIRRGPGSTEVIFLKKKDEDEGEEELEEE